MQPLGLGIGWRAELAVIIDRLDGLGFVEITAENHPNPQSLPHHLHQLRSRGVKIIVHGIGLSLGGAEPIDPKRVQSLADLARAVDAPVISEHIAFVRAGGREAGHLLPIPRTKAALRVLVDNVNRAQDLLGRKIALENISALFEWPDREMAEADFITAALDQTGATLLLDVANVYANARNLGGDPAAFLDRLPLDRIAYCHMGGGYEKEGVYHDTHAHAVPQGAIDLLAALCERVSPPGVMLERDDRYPPEAELRAEMERIAAAYRGAAHA